MNTSQSSPAACCLWEKGSEGGDGGRRVNPFVLTADKPQRLFTQKTEDLLVLLIIYLFILLCGVIISCYAAVAEFPCIGLDCQR